LVVSNLGHEFIRIGHWLQRIFPPAYERAMELMNDRLVQVGERAALPPADELGG
jgi:hypothetical protein